MMMFSILLGAAFLLSGPVALAASGDSNESATLVPPTGSGEVVLPAMQRQHAALQQQQPEMVSSAVLPSHRLTKRNYYPRFYRSFKMPSYNERRASDIAEAKRFLPFHPLARFRGLSMSSSGRGSSIGRASGGAVISSLREDPDDRWGNSRSITPFSDMLLQAPAAMPADLMEREPHHDFQGDDSGFMSDSNDLAIEEAFKNRLGSVMKPDADQLQDIEEEESDQRQQQEDAVKAGDLLKLLLSVNSHRNLGNSLRFGFTK